ncbi:SMI1/KNR4 family protein [Streptomyces sp. NPDC087428]|uniref:SMI1/KNR4 family protein n=1 Tax=Streptomyces sp. NPDC087428 TaxID=3365788 RepID=UPI0038073F39
MFVEPTPRGSLSEEALRELESQLGFPLPDEYRAWLARTNGAEFPFDREGGTFTEPVLAGYDYGIDEDLYGYRTGGNTHTELLVAHSDRGDLPMDYLPIMRLTTGAILIKVTEPRLGSIWHRGESSFTDDGVYLPDTPDDDPDEVAGTFGAFLGMWSIDDGSDDTGSSTAS